MNRHKSDMQILSEVAHDYILDVPNIRYMILPTFFVMIIAKLLEVQVSDVYKDLSRVLDKGTGIFGAILKYAIIYISSVILSELQSLFICKAGQQGYRQANRGIYKRFIEMHPENFKSIGKGEMQNIISRKATAVKDIIDVFTLNFMPTFILIFFASIKVLINVGLAPVILTLFAIFCFAIATIKITKWRNGMRININKTTNMASNIQVDGMLNHEAIYTHNNQGYEIHRYNKSLKDVEYHSTRLEKSKYLLNLAQRGIWCILSICAITMMANGFMTEKLESRTLIFFVSLIAILTKSLDNFGFMYGKYQEALINIRAVEMHGVCEQLCGDAILSRLDNSIEIRDLKLKSGEKTLFENANFEINRGEKVVIVGKNGVGKSSLLRSILKLKSIESGDISIDGFDVENICDESFRSIISYVPQETHLFNESVMYNIKYGSHKVFDEDIIRLSKEFGLHDSIMRLDDGYNTNVGERGSGLSGGERQKVIILRALARSCSILIMDEPTAALDKEAEFNIMRKILDRKDLTVIAIVHNLELLPLFNKVIVVEKTGVKQIDKPQEVDITKYICS